MSTVLQGHLVSYALYVVVIMPDHAHLIATPDAQTNLQNLTKFIKGTSAHHIGGRVWQRGYFDRIIRRDEDLRRLGEYVVLNPVRAGLVANVNDYRWLWRSWVEGRG
jgi:REP element-mobilizing transposase RayT